MDASDFFYEHAGYSEAAPEEPTTPPYSATGWARENGEHLTYMAALDNFTPSRRGAYGLIHRYSNDRVTGAYVLEGRSQFKDATDAAFLIDDGRTVQPVYVAGWNPNSDDLVLHPFPTNFTPDGEPVMRADRDEQVDYFGWSLGPRRTYHLKVQAVTD